MIVIADNDRETVALLSEALRRFGYEVLAVESAEEALRAALENRPDLVFVETNLPGTSGYTVCRALKDRYGPSLPVFFVSRERTEPFDRVAGLLLGADDYLVKPFDPGEVVARVRRFVAPPDARTGSEEEQAWNLTRREQEVLDLVARGHTDADISQRLQIAPKTVGTHVQRILVKLRVHSRAQAVAAVYLAAPQAIKPER